MARKVPKGYKSVKAPEKKEPIKMTKPMISIGKGKPLGPCIQDY